MGPESQGDLMTDEELRADGLLHVDDELQKIVKNPNRTTRQQMANRLSEKLKVVACPTPEPVKVCPQVRVHSPGDVVALYAQQLVTAEECREWLGLPVEQPKGELEKSRDLDKGEQLYTRKEWRRLEEDQMALYKECLVDGFRPGDAKVGRFVRDEVLPTFDKEGPAINIVPVDAQFMEVSDLVPNEPGEAEHFKVYLPARGMDAPAFKRWIESSLLYAWWLDQILKSARMQDRLDDGPPLPPEKVGRKND